jgi:hypothetical protein
VDGLGRVSVDGALSYRGHSPALRWCCWFVFGFDAANGISVCSYLQALACVKESRERCEKLGVPCLRPHDYYAEMMKDDKHMNKVRVVFLSAPCMSLF